MEFQDIVQQAGFSVIGAVVAIAEHSIAHKYATNRPDKDDYGILKEFAEKISEKLKTNDFSTPAIPGGKYKVTWPTIIKITWPTFITETDPLRL